MCTVKEEDDFACGLSFDASQARGLCGPPKSLIFNVMVTGVVAWVKCIGFLVSLGGSSSGSVSLIS